MFSEVSEKIGQVNYIKFFSRSSFGFFLLLGYNLNSSFGDTMLEVETGDLKLTAFDDCRDWEVLCWGEIPASSIKKGEASGGNKMIDGDNKDLAFLKDMKKEYSRCLDDVGSYQMLGKMIDDWIDELQSEKEKETK